MTNNELTLEQAIQHTDEKAAALSGPCAEQHKQLAEWLRELQERRKVDSEPVIVVGDDGGDALSYRRLIQSFAPGTKLYRHAQQPVVDADDNFYSWFGREWQDNYQHNQYTTAAKQMLGVMAESAWKAATERQRQKQSVSVPDVKIYEDVPYEVGRFKTHRDCYCDGWNACRAAMLQELKKVQELKRSAGVTKMCRYCTPNLRRNPIAARRKTSSLQRKAQSITVIYQSANAQGVRLLPESAQKWPSTLW